TQTQTHARILPQELGCSSGVVLSTVGASASASASASAGSGGCSQMLLGQPEEGIVGEEKSMRQ
ncbi:hypothetical protein, partial [Aeromonas piscicola]|uniref:hypothetical protein n=1 Tax=Aeromonas piscicola TaxID=600645 RepID=UPI0028EB3FBD